MSSSLGSSGLSAWWSNSSTSRCRTNKRCSGQLRHRWINGWWQQWLYWNGVGGVGFLWYDFELVGSMSCFDRSGWNRIPVGGCRVLSEQGVLSDRCSSIVNFLLPSLGAGSASSQAGERGVDCEAIAVEWMVEKRTPTGSMMSSTIPAGVANSAVFSGR